MELPSWFKFLPTEEELITYYLSPKMRHPNLSSEGLILEVDIYKFHPAELTLEYEGNGHDGTWYFFMQVHRRFEKRSVINRETPKGTWRASTSTMVKDCRGVKIGAIKKLVFWETMDRKEDGKKDKKKDEKKKDKKKTDWILHEYRIEDLVDSCVLCKIYHKKKNELDDNKGKIKGTQPLNQILPIHVSKPSSVVKTQPKNQPLANNLARNCHTELHKSQSWNPVTTILQPI